MAALRPADRKSGLLAPLAGDETKVPITRVDQLLIGVGTKRFETRP